MSRKTRTLWLKLNCLKSSSQLCERDTTGKTPGYNQYHRLAQL